MIARLFKLSENKHCLQRPHALTWSGINRESCRRPTFGLFVERKCYPSRRKLTPTPLRTFARRCCPLCSRLCHPFCTNKKFCHAWNCESISSFFLLLLFFLFVGVGGSAQGDVVLKIRSQIRVSSCSFGVRRRRVFFSSGFFFTPHSKLFPANPESADWTAGSFINASRSRIRCFAGQRKTQEVCDL